MTEGSARCQQRFSRVPRSCSRYVWDPLVHDYFEENCYFYILRASDPDWTTVLAERLERRLAGAGVPGVTAYGLYGFYDALIRVWATEGVRRRIVRILRSLANVIEDIGEFRVDHANYTFASAHPTEEAITALIPQIDEVLEAEALSTYSANAEKSFEKLQSNSIIHEIPNVAGVKFYMLLKRVGDRQVMPAEQEAKRLLSSCRESQIEAVSVYTGLGSFAHLVKGVRPTFDELLPALRTVHKEAQSLGLRSMTFPIANLSEANEADLLCRIDWRRRESQISASLADEILQTLGIRDNSVVLEGLTDQQLAAFLTLFSRYKSEFGTTGQWRRMSGVLRASLLGDREQLGDLFSFLTYMEGDLRLFLPRLLADELGHNWHRDLTNETSLPDDIDQWTLRQHMDALRWAKDQSPAINDFLETHLGKDWTSGLRKVQDLRNDYAHGRLLSHPPSRFTAFDGEWGAVLDYLFEAAKLAKGLSAAAEQTSNP